MGCFSSCAPNGAGANGSSGARSSSGQANSGTIDPAWGTFVIASPSPGAPNPLNLRVDGTDLVYSFDPPATSAAVTVTYITQRAIGSSSPPPAGTPVSPPGTSQAGDDPLHIESQAAENHFTVRVVYERFYQGNYLVNAFINSATTAAASQTFAVQ